MRRAREQGVTNYPDAQVGCTAGPATTVASSSKENAVLAPAPISFDELNAADRGQGVHILLLSVSCCVAMILTSSINSSICIGD